MGRDTESGTWDRTLRVEHGTGQAESGTWNRPGREWSMEPARPRVEHGTGQADCLSEGEGDRPKTGSVQLWWSWPQEPVAMTNDRRECVGGRGAGGRVGGEGGGGTEGGEGGPAVVRRGGGKAEGETG